MNTPTQRLLAISGVWEYNVRDYGLTGLYIMANIAANTQYKPNNLNERVTKLLSEALALYVIHKSGPDTDIEALAVSRKLLDEFSQGCAIFVGEVDYPKDAIQSSHPGYEKLIVGSRPYYNKKENMIYSEMIY